MPLAHVLWQSVFYGFGLIALISFSFWTINNFQIAPAFSFENYRAIIGGNTYRDAMLQSLWLASTTAVFAVVFGLPLSHAISAYVPLRLRLLVVFALFLPFFSNYVIRMFAWQQWLNENGMLPFLLRGIGVSGTPRLIYTLFAVRIGLLSVLLPIATLMIYLSIARMDKTLLPAARNLGASAGQAFRYVTFPHSFPGIATAFVFSFIIAFGDFIAPSVLGGNQTYLLSTLVEDRVRINDWPTAAALGAIMILFCVLLISVVFGALGFGQGEIRKIWSNPRA
ncbi:MAG: spermidine/putrescine transport system permease protein [Verrucomicrobiota bacterium]